MPQNKTIKINPELFGLKKSKKTEKKRNMNIEKQVIKKNILKKKFLDKIKAYRGGNTSENNINTTNTKKGNNKAKDDDNFENEFRDSIDYLSELSKERQINVRKQDNQHQKNKNKNKTLRNLSSIETHSHSRPQVELQLPDSLKNNPLSVVSNNIIEHNISTQNRPPMKITLPPAPPYGCLKNGSRPTYKQWNNTRRNMGSIQETPDSQKTNANNTIPQKYLDVLNNNSNDRERKLQLLRNRTQREQRTDSLVLDKNKPDNQIYILPTTMKTTPNVSNSSVVSGSTIDNNSVIPIITNTISEPNPNPNPNEEKKKKFRKKITKKTIHRKYTLGKSTIYRKVSILLKDNRTRKRVIDAEREMKKKSINEIKTYLKKHGLLKVGSTAPHNILRKTYESVMFTGDIHNKSQDLLLHNFISETDV